MVVHAHKLRIWTVQIGRSDQGYPCVIVTMGLMRQPSHTQRKANPNQPTWDTVSVQTYLGSAPWEPDTPLPMASSSLTVCRCKGPSKRQALPTPDTPAHHSQGKQVLVSLTFPLSLLPPSLPLCLSLCLSLPSLLLPSQYLLSKLHTQALSAWHILLIATGLTRPAKVPARTVS